MHVYLLNMFTKWWQEMCSIAKHTFYSLSVRIVLFSRSYMGCLLILFPSRYSVRVVLFSRFWHFQLIIIPLRYSVRIHGIVLFFPILVCPLITFPPRYSVRVVWFSKHGMSINTYSPQVQCVCVCWGGVGVCVCGCVWGGVCVCVCVVLLPDPGMSINTIHP